MKNLASCAFFKVRILTFYLEREPFLPAATPPLSGPQCQPREPHRNLFCTLPKLLFKSPARGNVSTCYWLLDSVVAYAAEKVSFDSALWSLRQSMLSRSRSGSGSHNRKIHTKIFLRRYFSHRRNSIPQAHREQSRINNCIIAIERGVAPEVLPTVLNRDLYLRFEYSACPLISGCLVSFILMSPLLFLTERM
jgi:hypothetical protein